MTATEWTLATVREAVELVARARGLDVRAFFVGGPGMGSLRIEVLRAPAPGECAPAGDGCERMILGDPLPIDLDAREVTCWIELPCAALDVADAESNGVAELVAREVTQVLRMRHGQGAAA